MDRKEGEMSGIEVKQVIEIYEVDDKELLVGKNVALGVDSHWNNNEFVVLRFGKKRLTVFGEDLKTAIDNATNTE